MFTEVKFNFTTIGVIVAIVIAMIILIIYKSPVLSLPAIIIAALLLSQQCKGVTGGATDRLDITSINPKFEQELIAVFESKERGYKQETLMLAVLQSLFSDFAPVKLGQHNRVNCEWACIPGLEDKCKNEYGKNQFVFYEFDAFSPHLKLVIEYDGPIHTTIPQGDIYSLRGYSRWLKHRQNDITKNNIFKKEELGIKLLRLNYKNIKYESKSRSSMIKFYHKIRDKLGPYITDSKDQLETYGTTYTKYDPIDWGKKDDDIEDKELIDTIEFHHNTSDPKKWSDLQKSSSPGMKCLYKFNEKSIAEFRSYKKNNDLSEATVSTEIDAIQYTQTVAIMRSSAVYNDRQRWDKFYKIYERDREHYDNILKREAQNTLLFLSYKYEALVFHLFMRHGIVNLNDCITKERNTMYPKDLQTHLQNTKLKTYRPEIKIDEKTYFADKITNVYNHVWLPIGPKKLTVKESDLIKDLKDYKSQLPRSTSRYSNYRERERSRDRVHDRSRGHDHSSDHDREYNIAAKKIDDHYIILQNNVNNSNDNYNNDMTINTHGIGEDGKRPYDCIRLNYKQDLNARLGYTLTARGYYFILTTVVKASGSYNNIPYAYRLALYYKDSTGKYRFQPGILTSGGDVYAIYIWNI